MKNDYSPIASVIEIGKLNFKGNIIPERWFQALTYESGRPHINAIIILSEIVYWYRPTEVRDESSGVLIEVRKKFKADLLQRNYQGFSKKFGFSKKQVQDAFDYLRGMNLIYTELRTIDVGEDLRLPNVLFIGVNPEKIKEITFGETETLGTGSVPTGTDPKPIGTGMPISGHNHHNQEDIYTKTTKENSSKSKTKNKNKDPLYPPKGDVVGDGLEQPSDFTDEALEVDTQNTTAVRTIAIELDEPKDLHTSTLAVLEKDDVPPPRENGSQIIKTAADVAIALESLCPALSEKEVAKYAPDEFDMFWELFGEQWKALRPDIPTTKGTKAPAVKAWNGLFKGVGKNAEALAQAIVMGTGLYWEDKARTGSRSALSAAVFLRNGAWKDAIAQAQSSENNPPAQRFAPFLTCFNQFRPMVWPEADESDLSPKATSRLEELVASCENSIERFEKALLWAKRDKHWGLERSLTFEEFLYSGKINEFHKKQLNAEKIGMDKAIAPDRKAIEAAAKKEASRRESLNRLMNNFRDGEISKQELREMLPGYGVEPDSVPEAC